MILLKLQNDIDQWSTGRSSWFGNFTATIQDNNYILEKKEERKAHHR